MFSYKIYASTGEMVFVHPFSNLVTVRLPCQPCLSINLKNKVEKIDHSKMKVGWVLSGIPKGWSVHFTKETFTFESPFDSLNSRMFLSYTMKFKSGLSYLRNFVTEV